MAQSTSEDRDKAKKQARPPETQPLENRYGGIGCAAVKAATLVKGKSDGKTSKGFASQTSGKSRAASDRTR